ncbi:biotin transporter BioY [Azorhizobium caulinodans]|nr:biotin transporter BioY [Azorhizobium caulinodans]
MTIPLARIAFRSRVARLLLVTVGTAALAGSAQVNVPMVPVPMTLQSYALVTLAALAGWRLAGEITLAYLVVGLLGLPVFSGAKGGISVLLGPTGGYLAGFLIAALVVGYLAERSRHTTLSLIGLMALGHAILLTIGVGWLATKIGIPLSVEKGLVPFLPGAVVKILLAAATLLLVERIPTKGAGD